MKKWIVAICLVGMTFGVIWLKNRQSAPVASSPALIMPQKIFFVYAIYYADESRVAPLDAARSILKSDVAAAAWQEAKTRDDPGLWMEIRPAGDYAPPTEQSLAYFGRGLSPDDVKSLLLSKRVLILRFQHPVDPDFTCAHSAEIIAHRLTEETNGFLWDDAARLMYTPKVFKETVLDKWNGNVPSLRREIAIHLYEDGKLLRAVTLGMEKYGLPNLVVNQVTRSAGNSATTLMTLCGQHLVETWPRNPGTILDLNLDTIKHPDVRPWVEKSLLKGATRKATVRLAPCKADQGDPEGPLYEITFAGEPGATPQERQESLISRFFGHQDEIVHIKHDPDLLELSKQAREKLRTLKGRFTAGLQPGERLLVKGPFDAGGEREWMWVEAVTWDADIIHGTLQNDPFIVKSLKAGAPVAVRIDDAFDYIFIHPDGTTEGNQTGEWMRSHQK